MKLTGAQAAGYLNKPDTRFAAVLLYGQDAMRVALKRQALLSALLGEHAEEEMRLTRLQGEPARREPALVIDALKAVGFFPGARAVFVDDAGEGLTDVVKSALADWSEGDATLVVTAKSLNTRSKLRKLFEAETKAAAIAIYDDPPSRDEVQAKLAKLGMGQSAASAMTDILAVSRDLDPGEFDQFLEKLSLYHLGSDDPVSADSIAACLPVSTTADLDDILHIVAEGQRDNIAPMLKRLAGQGVQAVGLCIAATRHFRLLHEAATHPAGVDTALSRARPPVFGPRKSRLARQAQGWGGANLEWALAELMNTDLALRSSQKAPDMAVLERSFIRLAMKRKR